MTQMQTREADSTVLRLFIRNTGQAEGRHGFVIRSESARYRMVGRLGGRELEKKEGGKERW